MKTRKRTTDICTFEQWLDRYIQDDDARQELSKRFTHFVSLCKDQFNDDRNDPQSKKAQREREIINRLHDDLTTLLKPEQRGAVNVINRTLRHYTQKAKISIPECGSKIDALLFHPAESILKMLACAIHDAQERGNWSRSKQDGSYKELMTELVIFALKDMKQLHLVKQSQGGPLDSLLSIMLLSVNDHLDITTQRRQIENVFQTERKVKAILTCTKSRKKKRG